MKKTVVSCSPAGKMTITHKVKRVELQDDGKLAGECVDACICVLIIWKNQKS